MLAADLRTIMDSAYSEKDKENSINLVLASLPEATAIEKRNTADLGISWIITGDIEFKVTMGWLVLKAVARLKEKDISCIIPATTVDQILNRSSTPYNVGAVPPLVDWCFQQGSFPEMEEVLKHNSVTFVRSAIGCGVQTLVTVVDVLKHRPQCLPTERESVEELCEAVLLCLADVQTPCSASELTIFYHKLNGVQAFINHLWNLRPYKERNAVVFRCLRVLYAAVCQAGNPSPPSTALSIVLQLVEPDLIQVAVRGILNKESDKENLTRALVNLCNWLVHWPSQAGSHWVMELMLGLEADHQYEVLARASLEVADYLFERLQIPVLRPAIEPILWHMMAGHCRNELLFPKVLPHAPNVITMLRLQNTQSASDCLQNVVDMCYCMMRLFPGYTILYEPLWKALSECGPYLPARNFLWGRGSHWDSLLASSHESWTVPDLAIMQRSPGSPVGLYNLGNTCYLNSVLQALFMTKRFCDTVLERECTSQEILLDKLQQLFALLYYTNRSALTPVDVVQVAQLPGMQLDHQQDSSEFLIHLLDTLHEQEKQPLPDTYKAKTEQAAAGGDGNEEPGAEGSISRWTTEEDLSDTQVLQRKASSLADCSQVAAKEEPPQSGELQQLSTSRSESTDSGIQSVGGDEGLESTVQQCFGSKMLTKYRCLACGLESVHTDSLRDIQLSLPDPGERELDTQELLDYFLCPERLCGDNRYWCERCQALQDGERSLQVVQPPSHLILTLKHFHFDPVTCEYTKLMHRVRYTEHVQLPTLSSAGREVYRLYAAVVHSGTSMDSGHYVTYARNAAGEWFLFNDCYVSPSSLTELTHWKEPDTPYILFYSRSQESLQSPTNMPSLQNLQQHLQELVCSDNLKFLQELRKMEAKHKVKQLRQERNNGDEDDNPPSSCGRSSFVGLESNRFIF